MTTLVIIAAVVGVVWLINMLVAQTPAPPPVKTIVLVSAVIVGILIIVSQFVPIFGR
jgi:hypothetical protein